MVGCCRDSPTAGRAFAGCTAANFALGDIWDPCFLAPHLPLCTIVMVACKVVELVISRKVGNPTVDCTTNSVPEC